MRAISEGLRQEVGDKIWVTIVSPGAVESDLVETISNPDLKKRLEDYRKIAISAEAIVSAMAYAIGQPGNVDINEIPTLQDAGNCGFRPCRRHERVIKSRSSGRITVRVCPLSGRSAKQQ